MALTIQRRRGRPPLPRLQLTSTFLDCLRASQKPGWLLAVNGGWLHYSALGTHLKRRDIPAAPVTVERFYKLADALNFPRTDVFR
jgi:hypothetical protein